MNACDALLFVSMYEGSPNIVKEALACNLPIVSVAVGDVAERLEGVAGCTCRSADPVPWPRRSCGPEDKHTHRGAHHGPRT